MDSKQAHCMQQMRQGAMTDLEASTLLELPLDEVHRMFAKGSRPTKARRLARLVAWLVEFIFDWFG